MATYCRGAVLSLLLLDTTFLIDAERDANGMDDLIADDDDTAIAAVTLAELLVGAWLATGKRRVARQAFVDAVVSAVPVIAYDVRVARAHAAFSSLLASQAGHAARMTC
jgi:tRNA(fMet)-specific endonuclease VapC